MSPEIIPKFPHPQHSVFLPFTDAMSCAKHPAISRVSCSRDFVPETLFWNKNIQI